MEREKILFLMLTEIMEFPDSALASQDFWVQEILIMRFNECNDWNMVEHDLSGTLLSMTFALIIGITTRRVSERGAGGRRN